MKIRYRKERYIDHRATGAAAKADREKAGIKMVVMARRLEMSQPYLSDLEAGKRNWSEYLVKRFNDVLEAEKEAEK